MCRTKRGDRHAFGHQSGDHLGGEGSTGAGHLGTAGLGGVDVLVHLDGPGPVHVAVPDGTAVDGQPAEYPLAQVETWPPTAGRRRRRAPRGRSRHRRGRRGAVTAGGPPTVRWICPTPVGARPPTGRRRAGWRDGRRGATRRRPPASTAAGMVPEVLTTTGRRPRGTWGGRRTSWGPASRSLLVATSMRTASRVRPRASGGSDASRALGRS